VTLLFESTEAIFPDENGTRKRWNKPATFREKVAAGIFFQMPLS
jgi:hypothetical protein